jgi:hypothetical protein
MDIIGTVLVEYHAPGLEFGKDPNVKLLKNAHTLAVSTFQNSRKTSVKKLAPELPSPSKKVKNTRNIGQKEISTRVGITRCTESLTRVWGWISTILKNLNNESLNKIFFKKGSYILNPSIQTTFNLVFFLSIPQLNQRLIHYENKKGGY